MHHMSRLPTRRPVVAPLVVSLAMFAGAACSKSPQTHIDRADKYASEGKLSEAIIEYRSAIQKDSTNGRAREKLAETYEKSGDLGNALGEFVRAADLLPDDVDAQLKAGARLLMAGRVDDAKGRADKVLAKHPENADALVLRANALAGLTEIDQAITLVEQAIGLDPTAARYTNLGVLRLAQGQAAEAEAALRKAVEVDPKSVSAQLALANFFWAGGQAAQAEQALKAALALEPDHVVANRALGTFYVASRRAPEAEPYFRKVAEKSEAAGARLALADYYIASQRLDDAAAVLTKLSDVPKSWGVARSRLAGVLYAQDKKAEAHKAVDEVIAKEPNRSDARVIRARFLVAEGSLDEALKEAQEAVRVGPDDASASYLLGSILATRHDLDGAARAFGEVLRLNPRATAAQVQLARVDLQRRKYENATQLAEQAARREPGNVGAQLVLVRGLLARGDTERAATVARALAQASPQFAPFQSQLGLVKLKQGDFAGARAAFEKARSLDPTLLEAVAGVVALDLREGQGARARARVEEYLAKQPNAPGGLILAAKTWGATKDPARSEEFLKRAIDADPSTLEAYELLGRLYWSQSRLDQAAAEFERLAQREPRAVGPTTMVGLIRQSQGRLDEAQRQYEKVVELEPRAAVASNNLAWLYASRSDKLDEALQLAQAAKAELPDNAAVNDTLGYVFIKKQLPTLALPPLRLAVEKEPSNPVYRYRLGVAYSMTGEKTIARRELEHALKLGAEFDGADDARKLLQSMD